MVLRCDLCRVEVPDEHVLADHTNGKRHQALLLARERFESSQNSSIYVTRIKREHDETILRNYFSRFGSIKNCFIDKEKHVYAIVEYEHVDSANKCLEQADHCQLDDGTKLKIKQRNHQEFHSKRMLISEQEFLNLNKDKEIEQHAQLVQLLNNQLNIDQQTEIIVQHEQLSDENSRKREEFFEELQSMFKKYFPQAKLSLIGSMANRLGTDLSDMDLVLVLNDTYLEPHQPTSSSNNSGESMTIDDNSCSNDTDMIRNKLKRNLSDESSTRSNSPPSVNLTLSADDLLQMPVADRLDYIRRLLRSSAAYVCHVQRIAQARCPVVRFCHKQQKIFCELSINNHLAVANTKLIHYFLTLEPKLRSLLYTIRLWLKQKDLLGRGHRFNTYTLFWMIVTHLQIHNQQLPSVRTLVDLAHEKKQHGPWNCSVPNLEQIQSKLANLSVEQTLHEFFSFYSTFDVQQNELSPWFGEIRSKISTNAIVSLADPFEHDHNLTGNISANNWMKFQEECQLAKQILDESSKKRLTKSWGLALILTRKSLPQKNFIHQKPSYHYTHTTHTVDLSLNKMSKDDFEQRIQVIFKDILLFEQVNYELMRKKRPVDEDDEDDNGETELAEQFDETLSSGKRRRMDKDEYTLTPVKDAPDSKEKIYYEIQYRIWQDRRKLKRTVETEHANSSQFEREKFISLKLKDDKEHQLPTPIYLSAEIKILPTINETKAQIRFQLQTQEYHKLFIDLTHFLNLYLPKLLLNDESN